MSEQKQRQSESTHEAPIVGSFNQSFVNGAEEALAAQGDWLTTCELMVTGWLHRRRAALQAVMDAVGHAPECRTPTDLLALQQHWMAGSFQRLTEDVAAWNEAAMLLSRLGMKHLKQASQVIAVSGCRENAEMLRAAGNKRSQRQPANA